MKTKLPTIKQTNARFNRMTPANQRIAIAKDVLAQIESQQFLLKTGTWATVKGRTKIEELSQETLTGKNAAQCNCCALGAAMLSSVRLANECHITGTDASTWETEEQIEKFFSFEQMTLIELAFERGNGNYSAWEDYEVAAVNFGKKYKDNVARAKAIFQNIIKNKGTFIP